VIEDGGRRLPNHRHEAMTDTPPVFGVPGHDWRRRRPGMAEGVALDFFAGRPWTIIGDGAFRYEHGWVPEKPDWGAWLLAFHSTVFCVVVLGRKNTEMDRWMIVSRRQLEGLAPVTPRSNSGFRADSRPWL
jgi:hypothetical protein